MSRGVFGYLITPVYYTKMGTEIERTFLVDQAKLPKLLAADTIEQGFLSDDPVVRVRLRNTKALGPKAFQQPAGRWPPNLVLTHADSCKQTGTRKVRTDKATRKQKVGGIPGDSLCGSRTGELNAIQSPAYGDETGHETTAAWSCAPECPVKKLDELSGEIGASFRPGDRTPHTNPPVFGPYATRDEGGRRPGLGYTDAGAASRFFPQFRNRDELLAWLKALTG